MAEVMMQYGFFQFALETAAYQTLIRTAEYRWSRIPRIGTSDQLQFTGYGAETVELEGAVYPHFKGGLGQIEKLRDQAAFGVPLPLVSGLGKVLGLWVAESIGEAQTIFAAGGVPHRMDFSMRLSRYDGGLVTKLLLS